MKQLIFLFIVIIVFLSSPTIYAYENTSEKIIVFNDEILVLSGEQYRSQLIEIKEGGEIHVVPHDGSGDHTGFLNLIAPQIIVSGSILANGVSYNEAGKGGAPSGNRSGGGGGGYGGRGGDGEAGDGPAGIGGATYNSEYGAQVGSYGFGALASDHNYGYGGGAIKLDAEDLIINNKAELSANGCDNKKQTIGGGSGGCVYFNGIKTTIVSGAKVFIEGGPGDKKEGSVGASGGGGGGRFKLIDHLGVTWDGLDIEKKGGKEGDKKSSPGSDGTAESISAPTPDQPILINPSNFQTVGKQPTFTFAATDQADSKFLKYALFISKSTPGNIVFTASQTDLTLNSEGWNGKEHFFSDELASYQIPTPFSNGNYYWHVSVTSNNGMTWINSTETNRPFHVTTNGKPSTPVLLEPASEATNINKTPQFKIMASDPDGDQLSFMITLSKDPALANPQTFESNYPGWDALSYTPSPSYAGVTATCQILDQGIHLDALVPGTDYYWKVTVFDEFQQGTDSSIEHFKVVDRPSKPEIIKPLDGEIVTTNQPILNFHSTSPDNHQLEYLVEISPDNFETVITFESSFGGEGWGGKTRFNSGETVQFSIPKTYQLIPGNTYHWRVSSYDTYHQNWSVQTKDVSFQVVTPPLLPTLIAPANYYEAPNQHILFQFSGVSESGNTLNARFELSDNLFTSVIHRFDQTLDSADWDQPYYESGRSVSFTLPNSINLDQSKTYYWRVAFFDGISWGPSSEYRTFSFAHKMDVRNYKVYPTPLVKSDILNIYLEISVDAQVTVRLFNKIGKELAKKIFTGVGGNSGNTYQLDVSQYASGLYFYVIEAKSSKGTKIRKKHFSIIK